jgi:hypothetical protein
MPEILPSSDNGIEETLIETITPEFGSQDVKEYSGPMAALIDYRNTFIGADNVGSMELRTSRGRGTLRVNFNRVWEEVDVQDQSVQELNSFDVVRPIESAPYFREMKTDLIASVRAVYEAQLRPSEVDKAAAAHDADSESVGTWGLRSAAGLAWKLLGHLRLGQDSYVETAYEFSKTWRSTSTKDLKIASGSINTVVTLPTLSGVMARLIDELPDGEWLKKPTTVQSAGGGFFSIRVSYLWAPKWSVIYGGTETGLDAV